MSCSGVIGLIPAVSVLAVFVSVLLGGAFLDCARLILLSVH